MKMSREGENILKYNQNNKSLKITFAIYAATELLLKKLTLEITVQKNLYNKNKQTYSV